MNRSDPSDQDGVEQTANPGYAFGQLAKALQTASNHEDLHVRANAARKSQFWQQIIAGMFSGFLKIGSRAPVSGVPTWATLEVAKGGFATGDLLAGGELLAHETVLLQRLSGDSAAPDRSVINASFLTEAGYSELVRLFQTGRYRVEVPEEGALLVVAWLAEDGRVDDAQAVLAEIAPFFDRLRFYPVPSDEPYAPGETAHLRTVGDVVGDLGRVKPSDRYVRQKETIEVWRPLYRQIIALLCETVEGPLPSLKFGTDGKPLHEPSGRAVIDGGWPCQEYPLGWMERARAVLDECSRQRVIYPRGRKYHASNSGFATLRRLLGRCVQDPASLSGREVGLIRSILAGVVARYGGPDDSRWTELRERQRCQIAGPTTVDIAPVLVERLGTYRQEQGITSTEEVLRPTTDDEARRHSIASGIAIPTALARKVQRCLDARVEVLVERGILTSSEALARLVPQITAQVAAASIPDERLRRLYQSLYSAFRNRRSLLLLNLKSQVRFEELPWVRPIVAEGKTTLGGQAQSKLALERLVVLALKGFPQQIFPNKLLQEVRTLASGAGLDLPVVDELAADIFMGEFSEKFLRAAQAAASLLRGSLYERYYGLDYADVLQINLITRSRYGAPTSPGFARLCERLASSEAIGGAGTVARNGKIIEQSQILTTHNLATLFKALELGDQLKGDLEDLAVRCFEWICRQQRQQGGPWPAQLRRVKNAAYAWRQLVFFLSVAPASDFESFVTRATSILERQSVETKWRLQPALEALVRCARGEQFGPSCVGPSRFLGWTTERHWMLQDRPVGD